MLLSGQGLVIERPQRGPGLLVGAAWTLGAFVLATALLLKASDWPVSFPQFLAYLAAGGLVILGAVFAFWTFGCASLSYKVDRGGITIRWGFLKHFISIDRIHGLVQGKVEHEPQAHGLSWWGYHVGRGHARGLGSVLFFSTHRSPLELVYIQTSQATYALSPQDTRRFIAETARSKEAARPDREPSVQRHPIAAHPMWTDRAAKILALVAVVLNVALWGYLFSVYPDLNAEITIDFPPIGDITSVASRASIFKIAGTATAIMGVNILASLVFQARERAATYLILSGTVFFQVLLWVGALVAVANA